MTIFTLSIITLFIHLFTHKTLHNTLSNFITMNSNHVHSFTLQYIHLSYTHYCSPCSNTHLPSLIINLFSMLFIASPSLSCLIFLTEYILKSCWCYGYTFGFIFYIHTRTHFLRTDIINSANSALTQVIFIRPTVD